MGRIWSMSLAAAVATVSVSCSPKTEESPVRSTAACNTSIPFRAYPWHSAAQGLASTGVIGVPLDPNSFERDLVVTNGNDRAPQPVTIYYNQAARGESAFVDAVRYPEWVSRDSAMHGQAVSADVNNDGKLDLVVSVMRKHPEVVLDKSDGEGFLPGGVLVYLGTDAQPDGTACANGKPCRRTLELQPHQSIYQGFGVSSVTVGDVDGDGWLDLAVAPAYEKTTTPLHLPSRALEWSDLPPSRWRIYLNLGKASASEVFDPTPIRFSLDPYNSGAAKLADVDQDQLLDLVVGSSERVLVFKGVLEAGVRTISRTPTWSSDPVCSLADDDCKRAMTFVSSLDVGFFKDGPDPSQQGIAAAVSCLSAEDDCPGGYRVYQPSKGENELWSLPWLGWGGNVRLRDMDGDDSIDLVTAPWWVNDPNKPYPARTRPSIYLGVGKHDSVCVGIDDTDYVAQAIEVGDFTCEAVEAATFEATTQGGPGLVTLPAHGLELIHKAWLLDSQGVRQRELERDEATWVVGEPWVAVSKNVPTGSKIQIEYTVSKEPDLVIGSWDYDRGLTVYERHTTGTTSNCSP